MDELEAIRGRYRRSSGNLLTRDAAWLMGQVDTLREELAAAKAAIEIYKGGLDPIKTAKENQRLRTDLDAKDVEIANTQAERDTEVRKSIRLHMTNVDLSDSLMEALEDNRAWSRQVDTLRADLKAKDDLHNSDMTLLRESNERCTEAHRRADVAEAKRDEWIEIYNKACDRIATMEQELAEEREMSDEVAKTNLSMACQLAEAKKIMGGLIDAEGPWHWMGDGEDFPESLACPVLMSAGQARELSEAREDLDRTRSGLASALEREDEAKKDSARLAEEAYREGYEQHMWDLDQEEQCHKPGPEVNKAWKESDARAAIDEAGGE